MTASWARYGDLSAVPFAEARKIAEKVREPWRKGGPVIASVTDRSVESPHGLVRIRVYDPQPGSAKPAFIYLHGGGWTFFSLDTHDRLMREYAMRTGYVVIGVDYALSPEAKFPVALDQIVAVCRFVATKGREIGVDSNRIAIGGDSAGGNLALAASIRLRDEGQDIIRGIVLNYAVLDRDSSAAARERLGSAGNVLTYDEMEGFWRNYLRDDDDPYQPLASPLRANLRGLPPTMLVVPEFDLLTEQSEQLAVQLQAAGVWGRVARYRGAVHSFLEAVSIAPLADRAIAETSEWLRATV
jgi:acetyl esterase